MCALCCLSFRRQSCHSLSQNTPFARCGQRVCGVQVKQHGCHGLSVGMTEQEKPQTAHYNVTPPPPLTLGMGRVWGVKSNVISAQSTASDVKKSGIKLLLSSVLSTVFVFGFGFFSGKPAVHTILGHRTRIFFFFQRFVPLPQMQERSCSHNQSLSD